MMNIAVVLKCSPVLQSPFAPLLSPQSHDSASGLGDANQLAQADEFMRDNEVTSEEVEEYHRISGINPPVDSEMGDERMFGLGRLIKHWNRNIFDRFRHWLASRRDTVVPYHPVVVNQYRPGYDKPVSFTKH